MTVADALEHLEHGDQRQEEDQQQEARDIPQEPAHLVRYEGEPATHDSISFTRVCTME